MFGVRVCCLLLLLRLLLLLLLLLLAGLPVLLVRGVVLSQGDPINGILPHAVKWWNEPLLGGIWSVRPCMHLDLSQCQFKGKCVAAAGISSSAMVF